MVTRQAFAAPPPVRPVLRFARTPKGLLVAIFIGLTAAASLRLGAGVVLPRVAFAAAAAALIDEALYYARHRSWLLPDGAVLTGMIVAFILRPQESWLVLLATVAVAIASKHVLRTRWSNVLNPAAVALVVAAIFLKTGQSWWGALPDLGIAGALIVLVAGAVNADRLNKLALILAFFASYYVLLTVAGIAGSSAVSETFLTPDLQAALFFAFFMLDDPPTSPVRHEDQVVFGVIVGSVAYFVYMRYGGVYYLPAGLLAGNVWESGRRLAVSASRRREVPLFRGAALPLRGSGGAIAAALIVAPLAFMLGTAPKAATVAGSAAGPAQVTAPAPGPSATAAAPLTNSATPGGFPFEPSFDSNFSGRYTQSRDATTAHLVLDGTATGDFTVGVHVELEQHIVAPTPDDEAAESAPDDETAEARPQVTTAVNTAQLLDPASKGLLCDGKLTALGGGSLAFDCAGKAAYLGVDMQITSQLQAEPDGTIGGILSGTMQHAG